MVRFLAALCLVLAAAACWASRHPANIPIARAKVRDGQVVLTVRFDILAFILEQDPMIVLDPPMNALLDGPSEELDAQLKIARERFTKGLAATGGRLESLDFPTAADLHRQVAASPPPRLPVMAEVTARFRLAPVIDRVSLRFPELLGTVVLTVELPYIEPASEPVEPGAESVPIKIPSEAEIAVLAATARTRNEGRNPQPLPNQSPDEAKKAIQVQYDRWSKAYMAHDVDSLLAILSPGYTLKTAKGATMSHDEYQTSLLVRKQKHDDTTQYSTEIQRITMHGDVAAIYARETTTNPKLNPQTGKTEPISYQHDYIDVWEYRAGEWRLKSTVTLKEQTLPPKPPPSRSI
jgi:hypothetical protein